MKLPYDFDLFYDIKTLDQAERIIEGHPDRSSAKPIDVFKMFLLHGLELTPTLLKWREEQLPRIIADMEEIYPDYSDDDRFLVETTIDVYPAKGEQKEFSISRKTVTRKVDKND